MSPLLELTRMRIDLVGQSHARQADEGVQIASAHSEMTARRAVNLWALATVAPAVPSEPPRADGGG